MQHGPSDQQLRELENRLLTYLLAKKQNVKSTVGTQIVMIFIMKPQRQQSDRDLCMNGQCIPAVLCGASGDGCLGPVCSVAADGCCTNGDTAVLTEGTTCVQ